MVIIAKDRQSLLDIAIIALGAADGVFALMRRNHISITDPIVDGTPIAFDAGDIIDPDVCNRYAAHKISPATAIAGNDLAALIAATAPVENSYTKKQTENEKYKTTARKR